LRPGSMIQAAGPKHVWLKELGRAVCITDRLKPLTKKG
jgi:hypothetical protein